MNKNSVYLTPSRIQDYLTCPQSFYFKHVLKMPTPTNGAAFLGTKIHEAVEKALKMRWKKPNLTLDTIYSDCIISFDEEFEHPTDYKKEPMEVDWKEEDPLALKRMGFALLELYFDSPEFLSIEVDEIEQNFKIFLKKNEEDYGEEFAILTEPDKSPSICMNCKLDITCKGNTILDLKTSSKSYTDWDVMTKVQFDIYAIAYRAIKSIPMNEPINFRCDVLVKTKQPKIQSITTTKTEQDAMRTLRMLHHVVNAIESEIYYPNYNNLCQNYCSFKDLCMGGSK